MIRPLDYSLRVSSSILQGGVFARDITRQAIGWQRSKARFGGCGEGSFKLEGSQAELEAWFYERLGYDVQEICGSKTWRGMIYEMDLQVGGTIRRRSLDLMFNAVAATYIDETDTARTSATVTNAASISRYGRREELVALDGYPQAAAEEFRDVYLKEHAWPWARPVGVGAAQRGERGDEGGATLTVVVCGYAYTAGWQFETAGDGSAGNLSDWLSAIVTTDCPFLSAGSIQSNTRQVVKETNTPQRALDVIQELNEVGLSGAPTRFWVDENRRAHYGAIDTTPRYFLRKGRLYSSAGGSVEVNPWQIEPAVCRDLDYPTRKVEYGGWLADARDFFIDEVEFGAGYDRPILKTELFEESELLAASYRAEAEFREQMRRGGGNSDPWHGNWMTGGGITRKMTREERRRFKDGKKPKGG